jgi:hypothetical protein
MTDAESILEEAADLCARGWCQNAAQRSNDRGNSDFCATGAINAVSWSMYMGGDGEGRMSAQRTVERIVGRAIESWNDHPARTQAEVVAMLRTAAAMERDPRDGRAIRGWTIGAALRHNARAS